MALFKNQYDSHAHSLTVLNLLTEYDSFLDSLEVIVDMGTGSGLDAQWWATQTTRDDPPEPRNYIVYAVDQDTSKFEQGIVTLPNVKILQGNFEERLLPRKADLIWAHNCFQFSRNPLTCLAAWKQSLNLNGMLVMAVPQTTYWDNNYNKLVVSNHNYQYYSYNVLNLMYMLAISGFDCKDAFFYREPNSPWLWAGVYASNSEPLGENASWHDLIDHGLINDSVVDSINRYGYARLEDVIVRWFDKDFYQINN